MGSPLQEPGRRIYEAQHEVALSPFWISATEVSRRQYEQVMNDHAMPPTDLAGDQPMTAVTWDEAVAFCKKLSALPAEEKAGRWYRLPTEAQWEYACRAGSVTAFSTGPTLSADQARFADAEGRPADPTAIGSLNPNAWGLHEVHGNAAEWCYDWFSETSYGEGGGRTLIDPSGPTRVVGAPRRTVRGGSWKTPVEECRSAHRSGLAPTDRHDDVGFRIVLIFSTGGT
jgi:formylglycine-generating enzyme required for sulfatase activity